ncbi:hypothetical protein [Massilia sp. erpn]|uniref:hypothetical protein n=1 Tax=Massilia sp. erpn TaxID=2738142 RepID=UPI002107C7AF|nr:hypothetical protein [Massilia sp. erpn]UTY59028.1 hypothetical protein HPQ68_18690 [Massilia sp. erpn]
MLKWKRHFAAAVVRRLVQRGRGNPAPLHSDKVRIFLTKQAVIVNSHIQYTYAEETEMLYLLVAILAGYFLGNQRKQGIGAYFLCVPLSIFAFGLTKAVLTSFKTMEIQLAVSAPWLFVVLFYAPVAMLGVYLARRKARRNKYEA